METAIKIRGLQKSYKDLDVLKGVDLDVTRGSIFALLGSNGAGKTTLVRILATLLRADGGTATVAGLDVAAQPAAVRDVISLTGQYLDEAEKLADRIAILHGGTIITTGTLAELRQLLPPAKVEYVERQPSLEEIFLAITGSSTR